MALFKLDVPVLAQQKSMSCWHASASMIWWYWQLKSGRQGPMNTMTTSYVQNTGLTASVQSLITLAQMTGLDRLPSKNSYSADDILAFLRGRGPLWCAGLWYGEGHVIVLTGISGGMVYLNDPDRGVRKEGTVAWFNEKLMTGLTGCVMSKDPKGY